MKVKHIEDLQQKLDEKINTATVIDEDTFISNSDTNIPTQQSVKAYVDSISSNVMTTFTETSEEFSPIYTILANGTWNITLQHSTKVGFSLDITINGADLNSNQFINTAPSNIVTIQNVPYSIDSTDLIRIIYKY